MARLELTRALSALLLGLLLAAAAPLRAGAAVQLGGGTTPDGASPGSSGAAATAAAGAASPAAPATVAGRFADFPTLWQYYEALFPSSLMVPTIRQMRGHTGEHEVLWQIPPSPRGTLFIAHGCTHAAHDWWPPSPACPHCLGLPEELAQTQQALARGYAVLAMSANNSRGDHCMDWVSNHQDAVDIIQAFLNETGLGGLPLFGLGVSVGGGFVAKLPQYIQMHGVLSEVLGPKPDSWLADARTPPTVFIAMDKDPTMCYKISADARKLRALGIPVQTVVVSERPVGPSFFSDRSSRVPPDVSAKVVAALQRTEPAMLVSRNGSRGEGLYVSMDPRHAQGPWVQQLMQMVPELGAGDSTTGMTPDHSHVWEEMNLAYSNHEIIADFTTAALVWFESGGCADFGEILARYGVPGAGRLGDPADSIPPGWQYDPSHDKANRASKAWALKVAQQQQQQPQQPYEAHEAVAEAAHAAVQAGGQPAGTASDRAAAVDAAAEAAVQAHVAASEAANAASADQQQQQEQPPTIQLGGGSSDGRIGGRVSAASLDMHPATAPPPGAPATEIDGSAARHRARVGATAAVIGGACGAVVAVSLCLVAIRIRQRRAAGFRALPVAERLRDELPAALAPIPEQEAVEDMA